MFTTDRGSIALIRKLSFSYIHILIVLLLITLLKVYGGVQVSYGGPMPQLTIQTGHSDRIDAMAVSPDSRYLASAALDHLVKLWDLNLKRELRTFYGAKSFPQDLYFSPDGRLLMGTFLADSTRIWDVLNGKPVLKFKSGPGARFTPDNKYICSAESVCIEII